MNTNEYNDPKKSLILFGLDNELDFLIKLYNLNKLPRVLMFTGKKGVGKFTLVNHFLNYIYDKNNYDLKNKSINSETQFYKEYLNNIFSDIIYLSGDNFKNVKIEDKTYLHQNHTSHEKNKYHLKLFIKSKDLTGMSKINSTKIIYKILELELRNYIHSIQIVLK